MGSVEIGRGRGFWPLGPRSFRMRRTRAPFLVVLAIITILVIASNLPVRPRFRDVDVRRKAAHRRDPVSQGTVGPRRRSRAPRTPFQMPSSPTILGDSGKDLRDTLASRPFPAESGGVGAFCGHREVQPGSHGTPAGGAHVHHGRGSVRRERHERPRERAPVPSTGSGRRCPVTAYLRPVFDGWTHLWAQSNRVLYTVSMVHHRSSKTATVTACYFVSR